MRKINPPLNGNNAPRVAVYLDTPQGGHWKYTMNLLGGVSTPCLLVTSRSVHLNDHWCAPIFIWSPGPHQSLLSKARLFLNHFLNLARFIRVARKFGIDIIHFQSFEPISIGFFMPLLKRRFKVIFSVHNVLPHKYYSSLSKKLEKRIRGNIFHRADGLFVFSKYGVDKLHKEFNISPTNIHYLPMGCHEPVPDNPPIRGEVPVEPKFLMFGGYRENKGFEILRQAFLLAKEAGLPGELIIAGKYPKEIVDSTNDIYRENGIVERINFINHFIMEEEIDGIMRAADVIVLPYTSFESQSGILFLAYAYNLPLISSRVGGLTELIENDGTGVLVTPGSPESLSEAFFKVLQGWDGYVKTQPSQLLGSKYSWEEIGDQTDQFYSGILS